MLNGTKFKASNLKVNQFLLRKRNNSKKFILLLFLTLVDKWLACRLLFVSNEWQHLSQRSIPCTQYHLPIHAYESHQLISNRTIFSIIRMNFHHRCKYNGLDLSLQLDRRKYVVLWPMFAVLMKANCLIYSEFYFFFFFLNKKDNRSTNQTLRSHWPSFLYNHRNLRSLWHMAQKSLQSHCFCWNLYFLD